MPRQQSPRSMGFTLVDLLVVIIIIAITAAILFPVFHHSRESSRPSCAANEKQILLAMLGYTQDYDERFPPVASPITLTDHTQALELWGPELASNKEGGAITPCIIGSYIKNSQIFLCPYVLDPQTPTQYRMNDLAASASQTKMPNASHTVLVMDGDDTLLNFGHSVARPHDDRQATYLISPQGKFTLLRGEAISPETLIRHDGGCVYGLADGHVKWFKPEDVFFPPRDSQIVSHIDPETKDTNGPDPGGNMTYQGKQYAATFHIR